VLEVTTRERFGDLHIGSGDAARGRDGGTRGRITSVEFDTVAFDVEATVTVSL
jgi:hypothetical protein